MPLDRVKTQGYLPADLRDAPEDAHTERVLTKVSPEAPSLPEARFNRPDLVVPTVETRVTSGAHEAPRVTPSSHVAPESPTLPLRTTTSPAEAPGVPTRSYTYPEMPEVPEGRAGDTRAPEVPAIHLSVPRGPTLPEMNGRSEVHQGPLEFVMPDKIESLPLIDPGRIHYRDGIRTHSTHWMS